MERGKFYVKKVEPFCHSSTLDCDDYAALFRGSGFAAARDPESADVILVNTCSVCARRERESIDAVADALSRRRKGSTVSVIGCAHGRRLAEYLAERGIKAYGVGQTGDLARDSGIPDICPGAGTRELDLAAYHPRLRTYQMAHKALSAAGRGLSRLSPRLGYMLGRYVNTTYAFHPRSYFVRISSGCANDCSYCVIKKARGRLLSRDLDAVVGEVRRALRGGYDHFLLVSDDFTSYGLDRGGDYVELLRAVQAVEGEFTISIHNLNPMRCVGGFERFRDAIVPGKIRHIHYVCQSGSDRMLRMMNRGYTSADYIRTAWGILGADSGISLRTDILVGFPGESDKDHRDNISLVWSVPFEALNVFPYTDMEGTPSRDLEEKVPEGVKARRKREIVRAFQMSQARRWLGSLVKNETVGAFTNPLEFRGRRGCDQATA
jgi:tRNA-2-methylthio-N6-dimethylallyladenosine synthase